MSRLAGSGRNRASHGSVLRGKTPSTPRPSGRSRPPERRTRSGLVVVAGRHPRIEGKAIETRHGRLYRLRAHPFRPARRDRCIARGATAPCSRREAAISAWFMNEREKHPTCGYPADSAFILGRQAIDSRRPLAAQSRRYRLIRVWYGIPVSSDRSLKYSIVSWSNRIVTRFFGRLAWGSDAPSKNRTPRCADSRSIRAGETGLRHPRGPDHRAQRRASV